MSRITEYFCNCCGDPLYSDDEVIKHFSFGTETVYIHTHCLKTISAYELLTKYMSTKYLPIEQGKISEIDWRYES